MRKTIMCTRAVDFQIDTSASATDGDGRTLDGYAAVFGQPTHIRSWEGDFHETISPGAFRKTLSEKKPVMQYNHGRDARIGTVPIGTFDIIEEDSHGLRTVGRLFDHPDVERVRQAIESGDVSGMSFTFSVVRDEWMDNKGRSITDPHELSRLLFDAGSRGPLQRNIKEVKLREAGPVLNPAYEGTSVGVRDSEEVELSRDEVIETYTRSAGLKADDDAEEIRSWLEAEATFRWLEEESAWNAERWLTAENTYRWLEAEAEFKSSNPDAAIRTSGTGKTGSAAEKHPAATKSKNTDTRKRMYTINEMRERIAAIEVRLEELNTEYRDAELPEAEEREHNEIVAERTKLLETIEKVETRMNGFKDLAKTGGTIDAPNVIIKTEVRHNLDELRNESRSTEDYNHKVREHSMRLIDSQEFKPAGLRSQREDAQERVESLLDLPGRDEQGHTIGERILASSTEVYERAFFKAAAAGHNGNLDNEERAALQLGSDSNGGYAIPVMLDPTVIWTNAGVINPLRQLARVEQIVGKEWQGVTSAGTTVKRHSEAQETEESAFTLGQVTVRTQRVDGFTPFTFEAEIGWGALRSSIAHALSEAKDAEEASSFLLGAGGSDGGSPAHPVANGLLGTLSGNTVATSGPTAFAVSDLYALEDALDARYQANASWLAHKAVYNLVRQFDTSNGPSLWVRIGDGQPQTLLDYPTYRSTLMDKAPVASKKLIVLGDFKNFLIVDRIGMNAEIVPHVMGTNGRPTGQRGVFAWWMNNSKVLVDNAFKVLVTPAS